MKEKLEFRFIIEVEMIFPDNATYDEKRDLAFETLIHNIANNPAILKNFNIKE